MTTLAFLVWPFVALVFFRTLRLPVAIAATAVGGYLVLPTQGGFDIPGIQPIDKNSMPAILALVFAAIFGRDAPGTRPGWMPTSPVVLVLIGMLFVARIGTMLTNGDPLFYGPRVLPGLTPYDTLARLQSLLYMLLPFIVARKFLATPGSHRDLLVVLAIAGLIYSLPSLYEVRMSPQINRMIYGYFPHDWLQHIRRGGFRPVVFLNHGLMLGIFLACAILAAAGLARVDPAERKPLWIAATIWLVFVLYMAKSLGAFSTSLLLLPVALLAPPRLKVLIAGTIGAVIALYPMLRGAGFIPLDQIMEVFGSISEERAGSLKFRLDNEDDLLARANERPWFGWGGWGRSLIHNADGRLVSTVDGYWIIVIGVGGWVQYIGEFGLLCLAPLILALRRKTFDISPATAALAIVLAVNLIDLIPNTGITVVTWIMAGALAGRLEMARADQSSADAEAVPAAPGSARGTSAPVLARTFAGEGSRYRRDLTAHQRPGPAVATTSDAPSAGRQGPVYARGPAMDTRNQRKPT